MGAICKPDFGNKVCESETTVFLGVRETVIILKKQPGAEPVDLLSAGTALKRKSTLKKKKKLYKTGMQLKEKKLDLKELQNLMYSKH